jgi:hypothetical protein
MIASVKKEGYSGRMIGPIRGENPEGLLAAAKELQGEYRRDVGALATKASAMICAMPRQSTTDRDLWLLAVHRILPFDSSRTTLSAGEQAVVQKYDAIEAFAAKAVGRVVARVVETAPTPARIDMIGYMPRSSDYGAEPQITYALDESHSGWIRTEFVGSKFAGSPEERPTSAITLAYAQGDGWSTGSLDDFTGDFAIGAGAIYDRRPLGYDDREAAAAYAAALGAALAVTPDGVY